MSRSFSLFRLQQIDSQIDRNRARLHEIEVALGENEALIQAQESVRKAAESLENERKSLRQAEENVRAQRVKIEQTESTLYGGKVRNPKELQDMQNEVAALKRYMGVLEDRQLEAMISVEDAEVAYASAASGLEEVTSQLAEKNSSLVSEREVLIKEVGRMESERSASSSSISPEDLAIYEKLRSQRRGVAVAKVTDQTCSACGSTLNASLLHAARSPSQIARCDVCGRILYGG
jgi:predicted  nucleic acid-binding Zn-ribbon protein